VATFARLAGAAPQARKAGAGEGNRTLVISLEGWMTAKRVKG
jgi:hypothetical protein